jgi:D-alanine--poly(phosphoribitol) ligase subunit 2
VVDSNDKILEAIYSAVDEINQQLPAKKRLAKSPDTVLFGKCGTLDSLGLVSLILAVEERIRDELDLSITLADERAMSQARSPFRSIKSLACYIPSLIAEAADSHGN